MTFSRRRLLTLIAGCLLARCSQPDLRHASWEEFDEAILQRQGTPVAVFVWAGWSRPSVELLPSVVELAREYPGAAMMTLCLDNESDAIQAARRLLRSLDAELPHFAGLGPVEEVCARLGIAGPPALILFSADGERLLSLEDADAPNQLRPEDIAAALETALTAAP